MTALPYAPPAYVPLVKAEIISRNNGAVPPLYRCGSSRPLPPITKFCSPSKAEA